LAAAEFGAIELGHGAAAVVDGDEHADGGVVAEVVTTGDVVDEVLALGSELLHGSGSVEGKK
jgi:hypothetical protein